MLHRPSGPAVLIVSTLMVCSAAVAQDPEFRAMWISRFEWPSANETIAKANIDGYMADLAAHNFNAVFFQIRGQADVLYPSPDEVWSPLIGGSDPGWDPLAYAVNAAHTNGIEFHAYINTHTCWQSVPASAHTLPPNPAHVFYEHCNAADPGKRDWLHHVAENNPVQFSESEYVWFAPGVPAVQAYTRQQVLHVVANYAVDGVHYDRIRTPWGNQPSYDPISLQRFADPQSNPDGLSFTAWTADQVTRQVDDMYAAIMAVNPAIKVSAALFNNSASAPTAQHQEGLRWLATGGLDIAVPMLYFTGNAGSTWDTRLQAWLAADSGRHVIAGQITSQGASSLLSQISLSRLRGTKGNSIFSITSFGFWNDYLGNVYQSPASLPGMPWKTQPTTAILHGFVLDAGSNEIVDAQVTRSGSAYTGLSSGDGFYSLLLVPPGTYTLTANHPAFGVVQETGISVTAGEVKRVELQMGSVLAPVIAEVAPDPDPVIAGEIYIRQLTMNQGVADTWTPIALPPGAILSGSGLVTWNTTALDADQSFTFTVRADNASGSDDESWQVFVQSPPPCERVMIADFEGFAPGTEVLFNNPGFSGSTSGDVAGNPDLAEVTDAVAGFSGSGTQRVEWAWLDTDPQRWMRLTTFNTDNKPNPTIELDRPIRVRLRLDSGRLRLAVGVRETGTDAALGEDGGTSGSIEWIGVTGDISGSPQGVLVEAMPGVWQTFIFDPTTDPVHPMTGDGVLHTANGKGTFEHLAFTVVDDAGPFTVYVDDVELLCGLPPFGDFDSDGDLTAVDFSFLTDCMSGPQGSVAAICTDADANGDGQVDLLDAAVILSLVGD